eukprot:5270903-Prymnesium_polylepis.1
MERCADLFLDGLLERGRRQPHARVLGRLESEARRPVTLRTEADDRRPHRGGGRRQRRRHLAQLVGR